MLWPHSPTLQIWGIILLCGYREDRLTQRARGLGWESWRRCVVNTLPQSSVIDSDMSHVFQQQFKRSPRGKQAETISISGKNSPRDTLVAINEKHKRGWVPRLNSPIRTPTALVYLQECETTSICCCFYVLEQKNNLTFIPHKAQQQWAERCMKISEPFFFSGTINRPAQVSASARVVKTKNCTNVSVLFALLRP